MNLVNKTSSRVMVRSGVLDNSERVAMSRPVMLNIDPGKEVQAEYKPLRGTFPSDAKIFLAYRDSSGSQVRKVYPVGYNGRTIPLETTSKPKPEPSEPSPKKPVEEAAPDKNSATLTIKNTADHDLSYTAQLAGSRVAVVKEESAKGTFKTGTNQLTVVARTKDAALSNDLDLGVLRLQVTYKVPGSGRGRAKMVNKALTFKVGPNARIFTITAKMLGLD